MLVECELFFALLLRLRLAEILLLTVASACSMAARASSAEQSGGGGLADGGDLAGRRRAQKRQLCHLLGLCVHLFDRHLAFANALAESVGGDGSIGEVAPQAVETLDPKWTAVT